MESNGKNCTKISGYLEKKGKKKMISSYKKYWFVLEGGLLLYYRSKDDYESISPCKGSINLGPPCIVKPCPSLVGVFQIQTRIATVTLRAENLEEQNRWMQAVMAEIQPNKNVQRMSHFRYSMENIPQTKEQIRNSTPESESSHNSNEDIIQRLQKMGAQSYGNPINTISKIATLRRERSAIPNFNSEENAENVLSSKNSKSSEHIYERISAEFLENLNRDNKRVMSDPVEGFNTLKIKTEENRPNTFILENETYAISIQQKEKPEEDTKTKKSIFSNKHKNISKSLDTSEEKNKKNKQLRHTRSFFMRKRPTKEDSCIVENDTYASVDKTRQEISDNRDLNENNLKEEALKVQEENAYSIPYINDNKNEDLYEDIDRDNVEYAEPCIYPANEINKKENDVKSKTLVEKIKENTEIDKPNAKIKKRRSFIKRVWKKKDKNKDNKRDDKIDSKLEEEEDLYETVPTTAVEKMGMTDSAAVQILSELQNILEHKMPLLMERISTSPTNKTLQESLSETSEETEENAVQNNSETRSDPLAPLLPPKTQKQSTISPFHDVPSNNKAIPLPPKKKLENVKSLDEILDELDSQESEAKKNKVKKLIKKFSEPEFFESDVILRNRKSGVQREDINSDELNLLLNELAKVTNAPILLPGVTSSLNGTNIKDEELSKLLPEKQRRFSEPDYDIPRPHKSLTIVQKKEVSPNVIGSTRFFGPILKPSGVIVPQEMERSETPPQLNSITPDSLESNINQTPPSNVPVTTEEDDSLYTHKYYKFIDRKLFKNIKSPTTEERCHFNHTKIDKINYNCSPISETSQDDYIIDNDIYAEPRSIQNFQLSTEETVDEDGDDEVFVDSLEVCKNEVSTEF